jgi:hypothetical protein
LYSEIQLFSYGEINQHFFAMKTMKSPPLAPESTRRASFAPLGEVVVAFPPNRDSTTIGIAASRGTGRA